MDLDFIKSAGELSESLRKKPQNEQDDPVKALMIPGISGHNPPGELAVFCEIIGKHFERREGCELYRIIGALGVAQVIAGRNVMTPTKSKAMFQMMLVAPSGSGKTACIDFIAHAAFALGLEGRYRGSVVTSLKQLQMSTVEAEGSLVYVVDDNESHVINWDNERSPLEGIANFIRAISSSSVPWVAPSPIRSAFDEALALSASTKMLEAKARAEGWILPRVDATKEIDYQAFARQNQDVARRYAKAKKDSEMAEKPVERMKIVPIISLTPDKAKKIVNNWRDNGSMGRTFFVCRTGDIQEKKGEPTEWKTLSFANQWKPRIPKGVVTGKWGQGAHEKYIELDRAVDYLRNLGGITGSVSARYGQLIIDMATLCAFLDPAAREGNDFYVRINHLEWAYQASLESLVAMRDYTEGEPEENGLEVNEWESIVYKVKACVEGNTKFLQYKTISTIKDRICRDRISTIISACASSGMHMTKDIFTFRVLECIGHYRYAPVDIDPENSKKVRVIEDGSWNDIPMTNEMRNLLSTALRRIKFLPKK